MMKDQEGETRLCTSTLTIMQEIAKSVYLSDVMMGKKDSKERSEIESFIEMACEVSEDELVAHVNKHMETRMFLVGQNITSLLIS